MSGIAFALYPNNISVGGARRHRRWLGGTRVPSFPGLRTWNDRNGRGGERMAHGIRYGEADKKAAGAAGEPRKR